MTQNSTHATGTMYEMPASAAQRHIVLNSDRKPAAWNVAVRFRLHGPLEAAHLETAINRVVDQHEILRTCFASTGGAVEQRIVDSCFVPLAYFDVSAIGSSADHEVERISKQEARRVFDLQAQPLLRAALIKTASDDHILLLTAHHAVCDGWSVGLLAAGIMRAYADVCEGVPFKRDDLALQYADYAIAQNDYAATDAYRTHADFWKRTTTNHSAAQLSQSAQTDGTGEEADIRSRVLPLDLTGSLEALARGEELTFFEVVLCAFALSRMQIARTLHAEFATPVSGRNSADTEAMVGSFANYLPVRVAGHPAATIRKFRRDTADSIRELRAHEDYRTEELLADSSGSLASVFEHIFICQRDFVPTVQGGGVQLTAIPSVSPGALHAMTFFLVERADGWRASCEIDRSIYSAVDADAALDNFEQVLRAFSEQPDATIGSLLGLSEECGPAPRPSIDTVIELPAGEAQQRYWMLQQIQSDAEASHLRIRLRIHGDFNPGIAQRALQLLVDRHEALRTTLCSEDGVLLQRIHPVGAEPDFAVRDIRGQETRTGAIAAARALHQEDLWNFDAGRNSWLRALVITLNPSESLLAITLPHTIADGWSCGILLREFYAAYEGLTHGEQPRFEALPLRYADITLHEQQWINSDAMQSRLEWWRNHLPARLAPVAIPVDGDHAALSQNGIATFSLDPMLAASVRQFAQDNAVTPFSVYGAALLGLLARYTHQHELSLVTPFANRSAETERIIGPFAIPILIHTSAPLDASFHALLDAFQHQAMGAFENAIPLDRSVELTTLQSRLGRHPANQISFFYQNAFVSQAKTGSFIATPMPANAAGAAFEWQFAVIDYGSDLRIEFQYDSSLWSAASIRLCVEHYQRLLGESIFHPEKPITKVDIATEEEHALEGVPESLLPVSRCALNLIAPSKESDAAQPPAHTTPEAPHSDLECALVSIWQKVFRTDAIGIHDDFFDLGGHSLILARIRAQLQQSTGHRIATADIFAAPTIAQLAERLQAGGNRPRQSHIFALHAAGSQPPLFLISQSMVFRRMVQSLHPDQPVYTVLMQEDDFRNKPRAAFEEIAAHYVSLIRSARPQGPYRVGGWCVSSWLAYDVARQLQAAGQQVDLLLLVDGWAPGYWRRLGRIKRIAAKTNYYFARALHHAHTMIGASAAERLAFLRNRWQLLRTTASRQLATLFYFAELNVEVRVEEQLTLADQVVYAASRCYTPVPHDFPSLLFRSAEQPQGLLLPADLGWSELLQRRIEAVPLPGDHQAIFDDPGAQILAQTVNDFLHLPPHKPPAAFAYGASPGEQPTGKTQKKPASCALANI